MTTTPRLPTWFTADHTEPPAPATEAEIRALVDLAGRLGARTVMIGHGRHKTAYENSDRFEQAWVRTGGSVLGHVSWPEQGASWLRDRKSVV